MKNKKKNALKEDFFPPDEKNFKKEVHCAKKYRCESHLNIFLCELKQEQHFLKGQFTS